MLIRWTVSINLDLSELFVFGRNRNRVKRVESIETEQVEAVPSEGFSLEELGSAYAMAIEQASGESTVKSGSNANALEGGLSSEPTKDEMLDAPYATDTDGVPLTAETILEAMLFLGTSNNRPIAIDKLLELFRGISIVELDEVVDSLNVLYRENNRAMTIVRESGGYRLQLVPELHLVRDRFYGKVKETQLTQAAIDCLSLVAYQPGSTRLELEKQWNQPAANMLSMLVRKGLVRIETSASLGSEEKSCYYTTERFLEIIGLESLDDLPLAEDL